MRAVASSSGSAVGVSSIAHDITKRKQAEETRKLNDQVAEQDKKQREATRALALARAEAECNATALERLGINAVDAAGKLKKTPAVLLEIADALKNVTDPDKREQIEFDLIAAGLDRKLIPALRRGADGFRELQAEGRRIRPPFTGQQIAIADLVALGRFALLPDDELNLAALACGRIDLV